MKKIRQFFLSDRHTVYIRYWRSDKKQQLPIFLFYFFPDSSEGTLISYIVNSDSYHVDIIMNFAVIERKIE